MRKSFCTMPISYRLLQGRDIGEKLVRDSLLLKHGIEITPSNDEYIDSSLKIDGYLGGSVREPVQIKIRKKVKPGRDDMVYELLRHHDNTKRLDEQLKVFSQQGRDYKGTSVEHYFVLSQCETKIHYIPAYRLREVVSDSIRELNISRFKGKLIKPFNAFKGTVVYPVRDPAPDSYVIDKVLVYIPIQNVSADTLEI